MVPKNGLSVSLFGNFVPDCPDTFETVRALSKLSRRFPDCPDTFQTVRTLSRLPGQFPDCIDTSYWLDTFQTVRTLSTLSGQFSDCPDIFLWFSSIFAFTAQKPFSVSVSGAHWVSLLGTGHPWALMGPAITTQQPATALDILVLGLYMAPRN